MNAVQSGLTLQLAVATAGVLAAATPRVRRRNRLAGGAGVALGLAGVLTGAAAWSGPVTAATGLTLRTALPIGVLTYAPDRLGGAFLVLIGAVVALAAGWGIDSAEGAGASRTTWCAFLMFALGLMAVPAAQDVPAFLFAWEVMAAASMLLVLAEHRRGAAVSSAGLWYAGMTQLSFLLLLAGFGVLAAAAGSPEFGRIARLSPGMPSAGAGAALLILGFATKAGAVPLHVWLPKAHPEAPSHVSAVMSAAMVKAGVYGILLVTVRLLPGGPSWWGLLVLALGAASAVFGVLQASVAVDLKRLLAYSTTENVGLILCAIGVAQVVGSHGDAAGAQVALVAALLLAFAHALSKTALFLTAGSIVHATGERDLDQLGGLWSRMPWTALCFGIGALGAAALPISAGFVAEWTLLQSLIHGGRPVDPTVALTRPVTVTVIALTAGLALLTFAKAVGVAFLGRPRSAAAQNAHEAGLGARIAATVAAVGVLGLGLVPGPVAAAAAHALGEEGVSAAGTSLASGIQLSGLAAGTATLDPSAGRRVLLDPVALTGCTLVIALVVLVCVRRLARVAPRRQVELAWGCGGARTSPRMQYTATSYAEPLVRVFDAALGASQSIEAVAVNGSPYLEQEVRFRQRLGDVVEERGYRPVLAAVRWCGDLGRRVQNGNVSRYLGFSFAALLVVLVTVSR